MALHPSSDTIAFSKVAHSGLGRIRIGASFFIGSPATVELFSLKPKHGFCKESIWPYRGNRFTLPLVRGIFLYMPALRRAAESIPELL